MSENTDRKAFEAWYKKDNGETQMTLNSDKHFTRPNQYVNTSAQSAWEGWKAAIAHKKNESVAEAFEKAAKVADDMADDASMKYQLTKNSYYEGASDYLDSASQAIRALIKEGE